MKLSDIKLWEKVKDTVIPLGQPRSAQAQTFTMHFRPVKRELDLHGLTVQEAHNSVFAFIEQARALKLKTVTVITGKSGVIRKEFPVWMANNEHVRMAHEMNGGGAFEIILKA